MKNLIKYEFGSKMRQPASPGGWYFASLPESLSAEIRQDLKWQEEGWGRLKATVKLNQTQWKTAIWFDTKCNTYLLPIKAEIRKKENLETDKMLSITIWL